MRRSADAATLRCDGSRCGLCGWRPAADRAAYLRQRLDLGARDYDILGAAKVKPLVGSVPLAPVIRRLRPERMHLSCWLVVRGQSGAFARTRRTSIRSTRLEVFNAIDGDDREFLQVDALQDTCKAQGMRRRDPRQRRQSGARLFSMCVVPSGPSVPVVHAGVRAAVAAAIDRSVVLRVSRSTRHWGSRGRRGASRGSSWSSVLLFDRDAKGAHLRG